MLIYSLNVNRITFTVSLLCENGPEILVTNKNYPNLTFQTHEWNYIFPFISCFLEYSKKNDISISLVIKSLKFYCKRYWFLWHAIKSRNTKKKKKNYCKRRTFLVEMLPNHMQIVNWHCDRLFVTVRSYSIWI